MALDNFFGLFPIIFFVIIFALIIYGLYRLLMFLIKVNRFIDEQERKSKVSKEAHG
jgi:hypothetical protein